MAHTIDVVLSDTEADPFTATIALNGLPVFELTLGDGEDSDEFTRKVETCAQLAGAIAKRFEGETDSVKSAVLALNQRAADRGKVQDGTLAVPVRPVRGDAGVDADQAGDAGTAVSRPDALVVAD